MMEKRALLCFAVTFIGFSIFLNSGFVVCHPKRDPFNSILGEENLGSWKDEILSSNGEAPGPANDASTLVLAENRTKRPDILSRFHKYRGGWDIANKHYWASVGFTGAPAFILAILWFISFGLALAVHYTCGWKININTEESSWSLRICLSLLILFTTAAAIGCILLSVGQVHFHGETLHTLNYVVNQSEYTVQTLRNVTEYLSMAKSVSVAQIFLPSDVMGDIDRLNVDLNNAADTLEQKTNENSSKIREVFNTVRSALIIVAAVMLLISILGLDSSLVDGYSLLLRSSFVEFFTISDTCMAMGEWVENPHSETALSNILPCVDQRTTNQTLFKSKQVINDIANMVNGFVGSIANSNPPPQVTPAYYNQSGPLIPPLCYPYDSQLQDRSCSAQELSMENASLVWQNYTCTVSTNGLCSSVGRLTPNMYTELVDAVNVSYALEHYAPPLALSWDSKRGISDDLSRSDAQPCSVDTVCKPPPKEEVFAKLSSRIRGSCSGKTNRASDSNVTSATATPGYGA
ncbi:hypothetical protein DH2020_032022 [Rehmannia glutinosa]|uniref:Transmembrane protein n=1 Tax=Rehmannia glutinosa TaxID=99300 RepID=A0ABR0VJM8_REHGL